MGPEARVHSLFIRIGTKKFFTMIVIVFLVFLFFCGFVRTSKKWCVKTLALEDVLQCTQCSSGSIRWRQSDLSFRPIKVLVSALTVWQHPCFLVVFVVFCLILLETRHFRAPRTSAMSVDPRSEALFSALSEAG